MLAHALEIHHLDDLRHLIETTLCEHNELEVGAFAMSERILVRGGEPCGIYFCIHGPRQVKLTAIWETDHNSVLFYNSAGERMHRVQLREAPSLRSADDPTVIGV
jgi:hypothetical protein